MTEKLHREYKNDTGEILRVILFHDNPNNPYRYRIWDTDWLEIKGSERNLTEKEALALIPDGFLPTGN